MKQDHRTYSAPIVQRMLMEQQKITRKDTIKETIEVFEIAICEALIGEGIDDKEKILSILNSINSIFGSVVSGSLTRNDLIDDIRNNTDIDINERHSQKMQAIK